MVELNLFHFRDRKTFLNRTHPLAKTVALLIFSTLMARSDLGRIVAILVVFCLVAVSIRIPLGSYRRELRFFMVMATIIGVARAIGAESWQDPATAVLRFAAIVLMGLLFADTTAPDDISRAIGSLLAPLPGIHGYRIGATLELTLSTIPLLFDVAFQVSQARQARCESSWHHPVRRIVSYGTAVFTLLLERAEDLEAALRSRNFNADAKRDTMPLGYRDSILVAASAGIAVVLVLIM